MEKFSDIANPSNKIRYIICDMDRKFLPDAVNVPTISFNNLFPSFFHRGYCCFMNGVPRRYADFLFSVYDDMGTPVSEK